jgi:UDP-N-acetyl-D-glucosamine dehydrogenase
VDDDRQSPSYPMMALLSALGADVSYHDPYISRTRPGEHQESPSMASLPWTEATVGSMDVAVIMTAHRDVNYHELAAWCPLIVDTRNVMASVTSNPQQVWKA